jgi:hypothetical protein
MKEESMESRTNSDSTQSGSLTRRRFFQLAGVLGVTGMAVQDAVAQRQVSQLEGFRILEKALNAKCERTRILLHETTVPQWLSTDNLEAWSLQEILEAGVDQLPNTLAADKAHKAKIEKLIEKLDKVPSFSCADVFCNTKGDWGGTGSKKRDVKRALKVTNESFMMTPHHHIEAPDEKRMRKIEHLLEGWNVKDTWTAGSIPPKKYKAQGFVKAFGGLKAKQMLDPIPTTATTQAWWKMLIEQAVASGVLAELGSPFTLARAVGPQLKSFNTLGESTKSKCAVFDGTTWHCANCGHEQHQCQINNNNPGTSTICPPP